jgi:hypothetical protein
MTQTDALKPTVSLLVKLGSIAVHCEELLTPPRLDKKRGHVGGHEFDKTAVEQLLNDSEVKEWIKAMGAFMPEKR